jgi:hypothetical protein
MTKKVAFSSLLGIAGVSLLATNAFAAIETADAYINIEDATSTKYTIYWEAETKVDNTAPQIGVAAYIYRNSSKVDSDSRYPINTRRAFISDTISATAGTAKVLWEIESFHHEYDDDKNIVDEDEDYDSVTYDPVSLRVLDDNTELDKNLAEFEQEVIDDILKGTNLDLTNYERYRAFDVFEDNFSDSLTSIVKDVMDKQKTGDILPTVFLNTSEGKGYILEKKSDGTSVIYLLKFDEDDLWKVIDKKERKGNAFEAL